MTREEKIALLVDELEDIRCDNFDADTDEDKTLKEAVRAIKALEQEPVLDKIRAEIEQLDYNLESIDYDHNGMAMTEEVHMICREEVLQIIDKYKAESEE